MISSHKIKAFTLVELAIVMTIIGLLIGGILKGQELLNNARINSVIRQVKSYEAAITTFRDKYGVLPGDMRNPGTRLPNCTSTDCVVSGNEDGAIGAVNVSGNYNYGTIANTDERRRFFLHLMLGGMTSDVEGSGTQTGNWGDAFPKTAIGGGFQIGSYAMNAPTSQYAGSLQGIFLLLKAGPPMADVGPTSEAVLTPVHAALIDRKMDDGVPGRGAVLGGENLTTYCVQSDFYSGAPSSYIESNTDKHCSVFIKMMN